MAKRENGLKGVEFIDDNFDVGIYEDAQKQCKSVSMILEDMKEEKEGELSPYSGMTKSEVLQTKTLMRKAGQIAPLTAFETCIAKAGIRGTDKVGKFFEYSGTDVLFGEMISDQVYTGELKVSQVPEFCYAQTVIESDTFKKLYLDEDEDDIDLKDIVKLQDLPETRITTSDRVVRLNMYGRYLKISKYDKSELSVKAFNRFMLKIGQQIGVRKTDLMYYRLRNGDGNTGSTPGSTLTCGDGANVISFANTVGWAAQAPTPYKLDKFAVRKANWITWITRLYDGKTTSIGSDVFKAFPKAFEWDRAVLTANYGIGVDSSFAIEEISTGAPLVEAEKLVRSVSDGTAISTMYEFTIGDNDAVAVLNMAS